MLSKNKIKSLQALQRKKARIATSLFIVEGEKMAKELLHKAAASIQEIFATERFLQEHTTLLKNCEAVVTPVKQEQLKKISSLKTPNKVVLLVRQQIPPLDWAAAQQDLCLYLADIQDPGNLGTILRIADWFGIQYLFASPETVELYNPKVIQASMGAFSRVNYQVLPFEQVHESLALPVYGTVLGGESIYTHKCLTPALIVLGNEGQGIPASIQQQLDYRITIPAHPKAGSESLNVGIATGIVCALFRQS